MTRWVYYSFTLWIYYVSSTRDFYWYSENNLKHVSSMNSCQKSSPLKWFLKSKIHHQIWFSFLQGIGARRHVAKETAQTCNIFTKKLSFHVKNSAWRVKIVKKHKGLQQAKHDDGNNFISETLNYICQSLEEKYFQNQSHAKIKDKQTNFANCVQKAADVAQFLCGCERVTSEAWACDLGRSLLDTGVL